MEKIDKETLTLRKLHDLLYEIIHSNEDLWEEIGELACDEDYLVVEDPIERISRRLDVIEVKVGLTNKVKELRDLIKSTSVVSLSQS